jgi:hypothetical protein
MSYDYDLEQPADVIWIPVDLMPPQELGGGNQLHFTTLRRSRVVRNGGLASTRPGDRTDFFRDGSLQIDQIGGLFEQVKDD